jgi:ribosomal protein S18 acetylase RimI-like enzyme
VLYRDKTARLYSIGLAPAAQGQGWGGKMMAAALKDAKQRGVNKMSLEVRARSHKVVKLYESFGFQKSAALPAYYGDGADGIRMVKVL